MLGKDFIAGFSVLWFFLTNKEVRVVTTSVKDDHLRVLWGELLRFIAECKYPLRREDGGPLIVTHRDIRKFRKGKLCPISYIRGMVSEKAEGLAGHHAESTLACVDEASGCMDEVYWQLTTWAKRLLVIGNPHSTGNFFQKGVTAGDILAK